ncbi:carbon storage regulator [Dysosmobacter sp.]|uniref:carbon storage regulator n=1 Tax=Dysosmobacter sp. TaxID=2591382 RepID=UPI002A9B7E21|nr:carbon storage regulator [Dysosmobacter sp.]MDY5509305.1 carbon storage regulator [Dysosmobacter sp.]
MLSLQLKSGEYLTIGGDIVVQIFEQSGSSFRVAVRAPREVPILRGEVRERTEERPDGLREKRPKSPAQRAKEAQRLQRWTEQRQRAEEERAAVTRELRDILDRVDEMTQAHDGLSTDQMRRQVEALRARLDSVDGKTE